MTLGAQAPPPMSHTHRPLPARLHTITLAITPANQWCPTHIISCLHHNNHITGLRRPLSASPCSTRRRAQLHLTWFTTKHLQCQRHLHPDTSSASCHPTWVTLHLVPFPRSVRTTTIQTQCHRTKALLARLSPNQAPWAQGCGPIPVAPIHPVCRGHHHRDRCQGLTTLTSHDIDRITSSILALSALLDIMT